MKTDIFEQLREVLAFATGHSVEEIMSTSQLEADLGVNLEEDFPRLVSAINKKFEIELKARQVLDELAEAGDTIEQLARLVEEEVELG